MQTLSKDDVFKLLEEVKDPEIPVLNVVEMGIVRDADFAADGLTVSITPTYSGCPAMKEIERCILEELARHDLGDAKVKLVYSPAWTTDWMTEEAREKLREYGIAPPAAQSCAANRLSLNPEQEHPACPFCGSTETELRSLFGSTACKALHYCNACQQPFEYFKCL